jgi:hypothetical protein
VAQKSRDDYPPTPLRRRALVLLLAVTTSLVIVWMLLYRPGDPKHDALRAARAKPAQPASSAASGVGGRAEGSSITSAAPAPR